MDKLHLTIFCHIQSKLSHNHTLLNAEGHSTCYRRTDWLTLHYHCKSQIWHKDKNWFQPWADLKLWIEKLWLTQKILRKWYNTLHKTTILYSIMIMCYRRTSYTWLSSLTSNPINTITQSHPPEWGRTQHMLQMDRLTKIALTLLVTNLY